MDDKGQISTLDLVIASAVFVGILLSVIYLWSDTVKSISRTSEKSDLDSKVRDVSEALVKTPGDPPDWQKMSASDINSSTVKSLGLTKEDNILDPEKLNKFGLINYEEARTIMGLSREAYNITITNSTNEIVYSFGRPFEVGDCGPYGCPPRSIASAERLALLGGNKVKISVILFTQEV